MTLLSSLRHVAMLGVAVLGSAVASHAATYTVTNTNDSGAGSLRQAVQNANNSPTNDIINFGPLVGERVELTSELVIADTGRLTITGPGGGRQITVGGNTVNRIFNISSGASVTINGLRLVNSKAAITNSGGTLALNNCVFTNNSATDLSGVGAAITNLGTLFANNCEFSSNQADGNGSSNNGGGGRGGAIYSTGPATINNSTFSGNSANAGMGGAIYNDNGLLTVNNSTFASNVSNYGYGGAIVSVALADKGATLSNCTFWGNSAFNGLGGAIYNNGPLALYSDTISNNSVNLGNGGAIYHSTGALLINNSIVAGNTASGSNAPNILGTVTGGDYNLVDVTTGTTLTGTHNITGVNPQLAPLGDYGGPTQTCIPLASSPAIDQGRLFTGSDQRGLARPVDLPGYDNATGTSPGGNDIGAVELGERYQNSSNTLLVNKTDDHNDGVCGVSDCTLREAIITANNRAGADSIAFDTTVFSAPRAIAINASGLPPIDGDLTLTGPSTNSTALTLRSALSNQVTLAIASGKVTLSRLTFANGSTGVITASAFDASNQSVVTITDCTFASNNFGIINQARLTTTGCTFASNTIGLYNGSPNAPATLTTNNCTFVNNQQVGLYNDGIAAVESVTIAGSFHGIYNTNNALFPLTLSNSLVVANGSTPINGDINNAGHNIIGGTAADAGLKTDSNGNALLADNTGPTRTIALVAGSPAIDQGATALGTDQRGIARDTVPDIGAFEFATVRVLSLSPQNVSDKVGAKRTFTLTVRGAISASEIAEVWLLINDRLSWDSGATLIYRPSTTDPTRGTLTLRRGDDFLPAVSVGAGAGASGILDNGAVRVVGREVSVTAGADGRSLTLSLPLTIRDGLVGDQLLFSRVQDKAGATDPSAAPGDNGFIRHGTYTVTPQFSTGTNVAPVLAPLTPRQTDTVLNEQGIAPTAQALLFGARDADGVGDMDTLLFVAGKNISFTGTATLMYEVKTRRLSLRSDNGKSWLGGIQVGQPTTTGILENSQVRVDLSQVKVNLGGDGKTISLSIPMQAKRGLLGNNSVWTRVQDRAGATDARGNAQGYLKVGSWNVKSSTTGSAAVEVPSGGSS